MEYIIAECDKDIGTRPVVYGHVKFLLYLEPEDNDEDEVVLYYEVEFIRHNNEFDYMGHHMPEMRIVSTIYSNSVSIYPRLFEGKIQIVADDRAFLSKWVIKKINTLYWRAVE